MNYKTRGNYPTGMNQCFDTCKCFMCKREGKGYYKNASEQTRNPDTTDASESEGQRDPENGQKA